VCVCDPIGLHDKSVVFKNLISVGFEIVAGGPLLFFVLQRPSFE